MQAGPWQAFNGYGYDKETKAGVLRARDPGTHSALGVLRLGQGGALKLAGIHCRTHPKRAPIWVTVFLLAILTSAQGEPSQQSFPEVKDLKDVSVTLRRGGGLAGARAINS